MKFDRNSRNALLGVILGDGYLDKSGAGGITHCTRQLDYLEWKRDYLLSSGVRCSDIRMFDNGGYPGCKIYINVTKWSKALRKYMYNGGSGKNIYNRKLLNRLSAIHLAIWYMDDGGLSQKKRDGEIYANDLMLNTHTTKEKNQVIIDYMKDVWGISFTQCKNKGHYRLRCGTREARKFLNIVREYVSQVPSMAHKLNVKS
jgi:hypothetical protein